MHETLKLKDLSYEAVCAIIAQVVQAANRQYVEAIGGSPVNPGWEELPEAQKQNLMRAVRTTVLAPRTLEESHEIWCNDLKALGYTRDDRIDHIRKTHPSLVPFNELPFEEQLKDALFLGITSIFASALGLGEPPEAARPDELEPAGEGDGELIDEIDEHTESPDDIKVGPGTVGEAAETAQEKLDNIPEGQGPERDPDIDEIIDGAPVGGYDPDNPPPEEMQETFEKGQDHGFDGKTVKQTEDALNGVKEPELPLPPDTKAPVDDEQTNTKMEQFEADMDAKAAEDTKLAVAPDPDEDPVDHKATKAKKAKKK